MGDLMGYDGILCVVIVKDPYIKVILLYDGLIIQGEIDGD